MRDTVTMTTAMSPSELIELTTRDAAERIARRELSPVEYLDALLAHIERLEPAIQAWQFLDADGARAEARTLEAEAARGALRGPMHGVPVGIKDVFHVKGMPTWANSNTLIGKGPESVDSTVARRFRESGAIILGKLHTCEFAGADTPPTRNPWNLKHTPGGSSSGSGAAVGARMVPAAIGTQTGGSNMRPAAYCGVDGIKGTYGRIGRYGLYTNSYSNDHPGVIARSVDDLAFVFAAVAGPDPMDDTTLPDIVIDPGRMEDAGPARIGLVRDFFLERSEPAMVTATEAAAAKLESAGAIVREVKLPPEWPLMQAAKALLAPERSTVMAARMAEQAHNFGPKNRVGLETGALIPATYYLQAQRIRRWMSTLLLDLFTDVEALLMPTAPGPAPEGIHSSGDASLLSPWSFVGYPGISIECGLAPSGLPMGIQFVGPPKSEETLFRASVWAERVLGRLPAPPIVREAHASGSRESGVGSRA